MAKSDFDEKRPAVSRFSIGLKLALIIGAIVLVSLGTVTFLNSYFVSRDVRITAEENNLTINTRSAGIVQNDLLSVRANALQLLDVVTTAAVRPAALKQTEARFFERNQDVADVALIYSNAERFKLRLTNKRFYAENALPDAAFSQFVQSIASGILRVADGETLCVNASPFYKAGILALLIPYREDAALDPSCCLVLFSMEKLSDILGKGSLNTTFMIDAAGTVLCHPDNSLVLSAASLQSHPLVALLQENTLGSGTRYQVPFVMADENGRMKTYIGAYQQLSVASITVCTTVPMDIVLEGVYATRRNNMYLTAAVLFISIMLILCYARFAISRHLRMLTECAEEIQRGNFDTDLIPLLNVRRGDEIGVLNRSTRDEQEFLNTFARFTNRGVAKAIARKEIDFEPHLKDVTVFFSDIRGFTAISDGFKQQFGADSPREIIGFLNDYMSRMVSCVTLSGGTIDKFEGDAIMAVWGILRDENLAFEELAPESAERAAAEEAHRALVQSDAVSAIRGAIAMRYALMLYNKDAEAFNRAHAADSTPVYKPHIRIGCGINSGRATCGIMGSEDKMEYTAIGDSVNFASRTESSCKPCGADILISEDTYCLLKADYIRCEENGFAVPPEHLADELVVERIPVAFSVKGKGTQHFYAVVNMPQFDIAAFFRPAEPDFAVDEDCAKAVGKTGPKSLAAVRALLGIPEPDYGSVNLHEEENKIQVQN